MFFCIFRKCVLKSSRPSLPLRKAPPFSPSLSSMVFTTPSVPSSGSGDVTAPSQCSEPLRYKDGGPSKVSPDIMERCDFMPLTAELASLPFCCGETEGDKDLEDFFHHNALLYAQERLGKTYCFVNNEGEFSEIVAYSDIGIS